MQALREQIVDQASLQHDLETLEVSEKELTQQAQALQVALGEARTLLAKTPAQLERLDRQAQRDLAAEKLAAETAAAILATQKEELDAKLRLLASKRQLLKAYKKIQARNESLVEQLQRANERSIEVEERADRLKHCHPDSSDEGDSEEGDDMEEGEQDLPVLVGFLCAPVSCVVFMPSVPHMQDTAWLDNADSWGKREGGRFIPYPARLKLFALKALLNGLSATEVPKVRTRLPCWCPAWTGRSACPQREQLTGGQAACSCCRTCAALARWRRRPT